MGNLVENLLKNQKSINQSKVFLVIKKINHIPNQTFEFEFQSRFLKQSIKKSIW